MRDITHVLTILALAYVPFAFAQCYPNKPIRYIVPFPAAASPDIIARTLAERLSRQWGQQVVVDNRAGAGGTLGAAVAAIALVRHSARPTWAGTNALGVGPWRDQ